ncbi:helix-turn-helix domain-containing protein, partial [Actinokineospora sp.]|uniref:nSTAND1 domain-containing NTPase n=1 Tax=Actinokineospora sp. TaxID=1872133 RepID=UPI003D6C1D2F
MVDRLPLNGKPRETPGHKVDHQVDRGFGAELRRWRIKRELSLSGLARLVHYSKGYLSKIENGDKPPNPDIARRCDEALRADGQLVSLVPGPTVSIPTQAESPEQALCPFRGLAAFTAAEADWFFGRERVVAELVERVAECRDKGVPVTVVAPSGAGKSSLLRAGLVPALSRGVLPWAGSAQWPVVVFTPTANPCAELARRLEHLDVENCVVVIDQFEEAFALCANPGLRARFLDEVCALATRFPVVLGVRADFYGQLLGHPGLARSLREG